MPGNESSFRIKTRGETQETPRDTAPGLMKTLELGQNDGTIVLWSQVDEVEEVDSPVMFRGKHKPPSPRQKEDLYKLYEQLTGPFEELTFKDFVAQTQAQAQAPKFKDYAGQNQAPSFKDFLGQPQAQAQAPAHKAKASRRASAAGSSPGRALAEGARSPLRGARASTGSSSPGRALAEGLRSPMRGARASTGSSSGRAPAVGLRSPVRSPSPQSPLHPQMRSPRNERRVNHSSFEACKALVPVPVPVEHGTECFVCKSSTMIIKTRCLVCGKVYCRSCVKEAMGSMLEGRKCKTCLGQRFSQRYIARAGKGWWLSSRVKQVELRWARKRPRRSSQVIASSSRSFQMSLQAPSSDILG